MVNGPVTCGMCGEPITQEVRGRAKTFCSAACRMRSHRIKQAAQLPSDHFVPVQADSIDVPVSVPRAPSDEQVQRAILEARALTFAFQRLGVEARPDLAWRCAKLGEAFAQALEDIFGRIIQ